MAWMKFHFFGGGGSVHFQASGSKVVLCGPAFVSQGSLIDLIFKESLSSSAGNRTI